MINAIVPITSEKRKTEHKATVLETRVVTGQGGGPEKTILNTPRYMTVKGINEFDSKPYTVLGYEDLKDDPLIEADTKSARKKILRSGTGTTTRVTTSV